MIRAAKLIAHFILVVRYSFRNAGPAEYGVKPESHERSELQPILEKARRPSHNQTFNP